MATVSIRIGTDIKEKIDNMKVSNFSFMTRRAFIEIIFKLSYYLLKHSINIEIDREPAGDINNIFMSIAGWDMESGDTIPLLDGKSLTINFSSSAGHEEVLDDF